ncbi:MULTISPECIES: mannose-6-phosphate isomerase, class I [unclassified Lactococcus]|uniref:mannose-6-phosphate isomerase, class I n=1 Tax=unclassified Lactococcus TaxID=2643510 RepID=UPI0011CA0328|nr:MULTISPECIES: mannose-6-phosphate isomerase, class I [unclassified Lactococcus]MQW22273.1 mannose-6-phosphate isomerase, class I [Lactococcus sp. dk101]TXK45203.1 mannose-6-phosphate isomerase, class I [Lactococcus sp. dk310]TXK51019.1 mannose-6-phosphate isomerase, class I [Lactococcus sp. dk322]
MNQALFLNSVLQEKIWGGDHLKAYGYDLPSDKVGEYWAISAHPHGVSTIANGEFKGMTLDKLYAEHRELFGDSEETVFPLLTKILDANDWLSVQVHPDNAYGAEHEGELGKTECWYIISAEPGAEIVYGHTAKSRQELAQMIADGNWDNLLTKVPVKAGQFYHVPSGTMHAVGAGIVILETQQSSDTTYRVYDFDRRDKEGNLRELHIQQSIDVLTIPGDKLPDNKVMTEKFEGAELSTLVKSEFFDVYKWVINGSHDFTKNAIYTLVSVLEGEGELEIEGQSVKIKKGNHFILPSTVENWRISGQLEMIASNPTK